MRIAVSGVAGTGKTTLCKTIAGQTGLEFVPDINDVTLREMGYASGGELFEAKGHEGMIEWHMRTIEAKRKSDFEKTSYVADKTLLDFRARWMNNQVFVKSSQEQHDIIRSAAEGAGTIYDKVIFLPLYFYRPVEDNGMRSVDLNKRERDSKRS